MTEASNPEATRPGIAKLAAALAKAQAEFPAIPKNRTGRIQPKDQSKQGFEFKYADLEAVIAATRPALTKHGLAVIQQIAGDALRTILVHESGEQLVSEIFVGGPRDYTDIKHFGIMVSYNRRYQYQSMVCVASDDDADVDPNDSGRDSRPASRDNRRHVQQPQASAPVKPQAASQPAAGKESPSGEQQPAAGVAVLSPSQLKLVRAKCTAAGFDETKLCTELGIGSLDDLPAARVNEALDKIKGFASAGQQS